MIDKELLKYYRELNNYTIKNLARKIKCPKKIVELWETGELIPKDKDLQKICELYNITEEDLIKTKENQMPIKYIITSVILIIIGIALGIVASDIKISIILPIANLVLLFSSIYIYKEFSISRDYDKNIPKSIFGMLLDNNIKKERIKKYLIESNYIATIYIIFNIICRVFGFTNLVLNIDIVNNKSVNELLILFLTYLLLLIASFIIELGFGEYMIKIYKEETCK